ncbi:MAG: hypothetical protein KJP21_01070 [Bacteroidia bacterium]|nr:hypothetical protein [Bacteroidia bacterium]NNJ55717.1 hypothetical protein [Bacteroidia bacterium]
MRWNLKHIILSTFVAFSSLAIKAQDTLTLLNVNEIITLSVDAKGYIFLADNSNTLYKIDSNGTILTNVNTKVFGEIDKIDCTNPFEIYTYHKDQNIVAFYDNMLNLRGSIRLNSLLINNIGAVSRSYDNGVWIYDLSEYKLIKINKAGEILNSSYNLVNVLDNEIKVFDIQEVGNSVFLIDSTIGVLKFDLFATYDKTYHLAGIQSAIINKLGFTATLENNVLKYQFLSLDYDVIELDLPSAGVVAYNNNRLYSFRGNSIIIFAD